VIDPRTNTVTATIPLDTQALGIAVSPDGSRVYVTSNVASGTVSVIDTVSNIVIAAIPVGSAPYGVAVTPDGKKVYVANTNVGIAGITGSVSVIDAATNRVVDTITVGSSPIGVAVTPDGTRVYVANTGDNTLSVIDTAKNTVIGSPIPVGNSPTAFGVFIQPAPRFAGMPGKAHCYGESVSALVREYHGLNAAAAALGFSSIRALEKAILEFCTG
jgi:YVTN family beta-propeller protein